MGFIEKRQAMSIGEQLANIGSEVSRSLKAKKNGQNELMLESYQRMLDLYGLTQSSRYIPAYRKKEIVRSKEIAMDYIIWDNRYKSTRKKLLGYYDFFASSCNNK